MYRRGVDESQYNAGHRVDERGYPRSHCLRQYLHLTTERRRGRCRSVVEGCNTDEDSDCEGNHAHQHDAQRYTEIHPLLDGTFFT